MDMNDARAIHNLGCHYRCARFGLPQDHVKALELWHRAGELGNAAAYYNIGCVSQVGTVWTEMRRKLNVTGNQVLCWGIQVQDTTT